MDQDPEGVAEVHHQSPLHLPEWPADPVRDAATAPPHTDQRGKALTCILQNSLIGNYLLTTVIYVDFILIG